MQGVPGLIGGPESRQLRSRCDTSAARKRRAMRCDPSIQGVHLQAVCALDVKVDDHLRGRLVQVCHAVRNVQCYVPAPAVKQICE